MGIGLTGSELNLRANGFFFGLIGRRFSSIHLSIFLIGFTSNTILLSAAVLHTPANLKSYSTLLKFGTVNDLICVFCDFINMQRILVVPGNLLYISYGPCTRISVRLCYLVHCLQIGTIVYSYYVMLASFIFRLWILLRPTPRSSTVFSIMIAIAIPPALVLMVLLLQFLVVFTPFSAQAALSELSKELLNDGFIWVNDEGLPSALCMVSAKNGTSVAQTCTMTEGFDPRSVGCMAVWSGAKLLQRGCYSGQEISLRHQCKRGECVADEKKKEGIVSFCCCHGQLCNAHYS
ncbi:hypothetical protein PRIPAC_78794 [Pristionchus pacificus]|uniref:G protein-coupled receptor n=1 Tax=Pristionchus pacificus TaxID=54126 RepID=A0A2A6CKK9_PRIPA|nr:hypothetical protein PRIPAC_78794 [Pristionchus pacificus]|eukprot:PDM78640.1 G protein-coupled receptor [Pristionchus pacificus]